MPLYASPQYRAGYQGYFYYETQAARLVAANAVADPAEVAAVNSLAGYCSLPAWTITENRMPVETIGVMRDLQSIPGRRECALNTRILVADGTFLEYAIRGHAAPDAAGTVNGLQLLTTEFGAPTDFGAAQVWAKQGIDTLFNTLRLEYAENQPVVATVDLWPTCFIDATGQAKSAPTATVLHWKDCSWSVGGTDYRNIVSRTTLTINDSLERRGFRQQFNALGATELEISRTPYAIVPRLEKVAITHQFHDQLPATLRDSDDWGTLTLRAEEVGVGAGRQYLDVQITHNFLNRYGGQEAQANQQQMFTGDNVGYAIAMEAGTT